MHRSSVRVPLIVTGVWLVLSPVANAALVRIDFAGTNSSPTAVNVWGTPVPDLVGYLIYDDATPSSGTTGNFATNYSGAIKEIHFSIGANGDSVFSGSRSGSFGSAQVSNAPGSDRLSFNNMVLNAAQLEGEVTTVVNSTGNGTRTFNNAQLTFGLSGGASTINSQALLGIDPLAFTGTPRNLEIFLSYTTTGVTSGFPAVRYNYNFSSLEVSQVPLPGAVWLLLSGIGSLLVVGQRRRANN